MNSCRILFVLAAAAALSIAPAAAFHSGGAAECGGCHSMHEPAPGGDYLLTRIDSSSMCLSCHAAADTAPSRYHVMTYPVPGSGLPPVEQTPGGDFAWLLKSYTFTVRGTTQTELGQTHGHNVIAADYGLTVDTDFATAPGGTYSSSELGCQSCHDQHGRLRRLGGDTTYTFAHSGAPIIGSGSYDTSVVPTDTTAVGAYRLLRGGVLGSVDDEQPGVTYSNVFLAIVPSTYNRVESVTQTRTAYGAAGTDTVGNWCASCHPGMHSSGNYVHPVDQSLGTNVANHYNSYVSTGDMTGSSSTSFLSLVPFSEDTGDLATLKTHALITDAYLDGPTATDKVTCLSCHRAHASGFMDALRWNYESDFLTVADSGGTPIWPGIDNGADASYHRGRTELEMRTAYYSRPATLFGAYQRALCNKCHGKD